MKVWVDVTGLYHWSGNFTGIQRIVFNLAKEMTESEMNSGLFIFHSGVYFEVSFDQLNSKLQQTQKQDKNTKRHVLINLKPSKINHYAFVLLKKTVKGSILEPQLRSVYSTLKKSYRRIRDLTTFMHPIGIFQEHDVVLVIDGNWQLPGFAESITKERSKHKFYFIHMVVDLIAYNNPALVNKGADKIIGNYYKKVFKVADALIAISESTKNDIENFLRINKIKNKPRLFTITLGGDITPNGQDSPTAPNLPIPSDFILSVSTIEIRKNYSAFYYVYNLAYQKGIKLPHLVIVGRKGWMADETYTLLTKDPKINKSVTIIEANDQTLKWLYKNCMFTVFPSFYEGWGLPVAESIAYGKCCISSDTSSMREVGKDLITYVSPYDTGSLLDEIVRLTDKGVRTKMEEGINERYKPVTWHDTFDELKGVIEQFHEVQN